jgi:transketolase
MNGLALYGGFIPYGGTFLIFYTYTANAIRMAALMKQRVIFVYSHDSIGLGEDGPTHQPIEQLTALRATPNLSVWRPCDLVETAVAWQSALENETKPTALLLSRQALPAQIHNATQIAQIKRGGYVLLDCNGTPDCIIMATGSEVGIAISAAETLRKEEIKIRVVSLPSVDVFLQQERSYQEEVLPNNVTRRVAVEAGSSDYWHRFIGTEGRIIGIDHYGESAPAKDLFKLFGFTAENIVSVVKSIINYEL